MVSQPNSIMSSGVLLSSVDIAARKRGDVYYSMLPGASTFRIENVAVRVTIANEPEKVNAVAGMTIRLGQAAAEHEARLRNGMLTAEKPMQFFVSEKPVQRETDLLPTQMTLMSHISGLEFNSEETSRSSVDDEQMPLGLMSRAESERNTHKTMQTEFMSRAESVHKTMHTEFMSRAESVQDVQKATIVPKFSTNESYSSTQKSMEYAGAPWLNAEALEQALEKSHRSNASIFMQAQHTEGAEAGRGAFRAAAAAAAAATQQQETMMPMISRADDEGTMWRDESMGRSHAESLDNPEVDHLKGEVHGMRSDLDRMFEMLAKMADKMNQQQRVPGEEDFGPDLDDKTRKVLRQFHQKEAGWFVSGSTIAFSGSTCIGEGTISYVFKGVWQGREVAVKMLKLEDPEAPGLPPFAVDLGNELACCGAGLRHANVVEFLGAGTRKVSGRLFPMIVYERLAGSVLDVMQAQAEAAGAGDVWVPPRHMSLSWCLHLLQALEYLHTFTVPLAHRDVRPANLLISGDLSTLKLGDFSLTTPMNGRGTQTYFVAGSLRYMAPEVSATGAREYALDKSDIYSAGLSMWCMLHGKRPFEDIDDSKQVVLLARHGLRPAISPRDVELFQILGAAWEGAPEKRPPAKALALAMRQLLPHAGVRSGAATPAGSVRRAGSEAGGSSAKGSHSGAKMLSKFKSFGSSFSSKKNSSPP